MPGLQARQKSPGYGVVISIVVLLESIASEGSVWVATIASLRPIAALPLTVIIAVSELPFAVTERFVTEIAGSKAPLRV